MRELTEDHSRTITLKLQELVRAGFLESSGGGRGTKYHLQHRNRSQGSLFERRDPLNSLISDSNSLTSDPNSLISDTNPLTTDAVSLTSEDEALIRAVASRRRARQADVRAAILAIARDRYVTVQEFAQKLHRKPVTLQQYLGPMADEALLALKHPDSPNHPGQAYRAKKPEDTSP